MTTEPKQVELIAEMVEFLKARQSHLGACRERCNEDEQSSWDKYDDIMEYLEANQKDINK